MLDDTGRLQQQYVIRKATLKTDDPRVRLEKWGTLDQMGGPPKQSAETYADTDEAKSSLPGLVWRDPTDEERRTLVRSDWKGEIVAVANA